MSRQDEIKAELYDHTLEGRAKQVKELTQEGLDLGMEPGEMLWGALIPALEEVGRRFEIGEYFVPEMLISARAMSGAMTLLKPLMAAGGHETIGTAVIATVKGDMHDIGKNLVITMMEGAGFEVHDLGVNVNPVTIVEAVQEHKPHVVGFSAFLTTTMPMFKVNIKALDDAGLLDGLKVIVGGAPVTKEYALASGADGFAKDASEAVRVVKDLLGIEAQPN